METQVVLKSLNKKRPRRRGVLPRRVERFEQVKKERRRGTVSGVAGANVYLVFGYQGSTTLERCLRKGGFAAGNER